MHEMRVAAEPELDHGLAEFLRHRRGRQRSRARRCGCRNAAVDRRQAARASADHSPSAPISADAALVAAPPAPSRNCAVMPIACSGEILHPRAKLQHDVRMVATALQQSRLQVAAMDHPVGRAVAEFRSPGRAACARSRDPIARCHDAKARPARHARPSADRRRRAPAECGVAFGESWMPAPVSSSFSACSQMTTRKPFRTSAISGAAARRSRRRRQ